MTDWNPQIVSIEKIEKHPYADNLSIATVLGDYPVVIKTNQFVEGQLVGYLPIDTVVPDTEEFYFLCPKSYEQYEENSEVKSRVVGMKYPLGSVPERYRVLKAKKIRNVYSQGMVIDFTTHMQYEAMLHVGPGYSITDILHLKKWEEPEEENISFKKLGTNAEKAPAGWAIPHYDIDSVRKFLDALAPGEEIVLTEKVHGSNAAFCHDGTRLWVKSRNHYKRLDPEDMWWDVALRYDLENKLRAYPNMVFFGEVYGQIKGFRYDTAVQEGQLLTKVRFFDIFDVKAGRYLDYDPFVVMVKDAGLDLMPELYRGPWLGKDAMYPYAEGLTTLGGKHIREGWVARTVKERYEPRLDSRMHVKLIGEGYNLQK
jgi:RNA ligase (TIGR02306 family)